MFAVIIACLVLASGEAMPQNKFNVQHVHCSWGVDYWCSSVETAAACDKTDWCITNYWPYTLQEEVSCSIMKQLITNVRSNLARFSTSSALTPDDIAFFIANGCVLLQSDENKNKCKQLVADKDILLKLLLLIETDLSTQSVAVAVGACKRNTLIERQKAEVDCGGLKPCDSANKRQISSNTSNGEAADGSDSACFICQLAMQQLESILSRNDTEKKIEAVLQKVCQLFPPMFRQQCTEFVSKSTHRILELLKHYSPMEICSLLKLCSDETTALLNTAQKPSNLNDTECDICKLIMGQVKSMLSDKTTQDEIKAALNKVCHMLPPVVESMCSNIIAVYEPMIIQMLLSSFTPEQICAKLNLCANKQALLNTAQKPSNLNDTECEICKLIMGQVKSMLSDKTTQDEIKAALNKVCHMLPPVVESMCSNIIAVYEPMIIQMLLSSFTPEQICAKLNLCANKQALLNTAQKPSNLNDTKCGICKLIMGQVKSMLSDKTTQVEIKAALNKVCHMLPPVVESMCSNIIAVYEPMIIQMLLSSFTPEQICAKLNLCANKQALLNTTQKPSNVNDIECEICKLIMGQVKSMLSDNATQDEIKAALNKECQMLPPVMESMCSKIIAVYEPMIIQMLLSSFTPEQICAKLNLCADKQASLNKAQKPSNVNDIECKICQLVMGQVKSMLSDKTIQDEVKAALKLACHLLPPVIESMCSNIIEVYEPMIIRMLISFFTPEKICVKLHMCANKQVLQFRRMIDSSSDGAYVNME